MAYRFPEPSKLYGVHRTNLYHKNTNVHRAPVLFLGNVGSRGSYECLNVLERWCSTFLVQSFLRELRYQNQPKCTVGSAVCTTEVSPSVPAHLIAKSSISSMQTESLLASPSPPLSESLSTDSMTEATPPTTRKCRAATLAGLELAKRTEAKFQLVDQQFQEELEEGISLPPSYVESEEEIECSPCTLFVDAVCTWPCGDEIGLLVYLCEVGMMDEDGEWHDGVSWELPEHSIHKR
eukprot:3488090-Rhodomonas_salina.2